ncbi:ubiquinone anaerobic biosynthesis accessory factor UbiT [Oharaeibacter diazotrophicus]|uniref:Putative lipid carrier protein YhbT n=2 Tax=Oharaeibacter diazotrophicus TaxID=1920512 RepID=A0A4R6R539_9HYPH|nr:lipid carrier [Oharaeibacter diazotrophicus]TDP80919.1 putative lipid carrier protein YhbT [Oharaeibacter diazotrophicus]BBE73814.1 hypothetical protein OHA_1_03430 [Pleomorphomonas sp. SM30]GLS74702.1 hypothetical protein GCM10007904_00370 [Oharaeibacter diazotrophicus]
MVERIAGELPGPIGLLARPPRFVRGLGARPLGAVLTRALRDLARRRPEIFDRLGSYRGFSFVVVPTDLGLAFRVVPDGAAATVTVGVDVPEGGDVTVRGPILALIGILDGSQDGDALFFGRTIAVGGRTDALLALRNAIEDAELKPSDLVGLAGPLGRAADAGVPRAVAALRARADAIDGAARAGGAGR